MSWELYSDHVQDWAWQDGVFTAEECQKIIDYANTLNKQDGTIFGGADSDIRNSTISWIQPNGQTSWIFEKMTNVAIHLNDNFFKFDLHSFTEGLQFTHYKAPSGKYDYHLDKWLNGKVRKLSIVAVLSANGSCTGGELSFNRGHKDVHIMPNVQGRVYAFPSYIMHRVEEVTSGERISLVGWIGGKPFK